MALEITLLAAGLALGLAVQRTRPACGAAFGADIPTAFYLCAAMPCAFHPMILARVFDVRPQLMRLLVVGSTVRAVVAIVSVSAILR
jgi:predicted permease